MSAKIIETVGTSAGRTIVVMEDNGVRTFGIGTIVTDYGKKDDSYRIETMTKEIPSGMASEIEFPHMHKWPEGIVKPKGEKLFIIQYLGEIFCNVYARNEQLKSDGYPLKGFADLCAALRKRDILTELPKILHKYGVHWLEAPDELSFRRLSVCSHYVLLFSCGSTDNKLGSEVDRGSRDRRYAALVGEQIPNWALIPPSSG